MPQDIKYIIRSSALLCKEAEDFIKNDSADAHISLRVHQIDKFLVDGRRQIRLWKKDLVNFLGKIPGFERELAQWKRNLVLAESDQDVSRINKAKDEISFFERQVNEHRNLDQELQNVIKKLTALLEALEDKAQELRERLSAHRQKEDQSQGSSLKVSDIIEGYKK